MKLSISFSSAVALVLFARCSYSWTSLPSKGRRVGGAFAFGNTCTKCSTFLYRYPVLLHGILDDITASSLEDNDSEIDSSNGNNNQAYERLFEDLVFSTSDSRTVVAEQLEACTDACFVQYLETLQESSTDEEERQALRGLLDVINDVKTTSDAAAAAKLLATEEQQQEKARRLEEQQAKLRADAPTRMSNADVLKKANKIDEAIVTVAASDDDLPDDFMRDAKAEVGLAGFNNKGQMRVGGD
mmetsp:Transcript_21482/g.35565  ORF Transcript_21482/g.35565 Transcript_21482/m.35565 type:complete len:243 (-) Transcript_21482:68-796(-)|eukprot:CAMPEP_0119018736 /NCGR_PEP_ID=MMETSP1176-20130426/20133_1 /TAXON_ID=265551 /ORGANISM="Synedropsis recta cf, Strain CCMP1620" /LENGTH=242 /DNA_ID=CAMNT_0006972799 /DNA_START=26 /DNA_END=754 /DNA_ORIENTATION=+